MSTEKGLCELYTIELALLFFIVLMKHYILGNWYLINVSTFVSVKGMSADEKMLKTVLFWHNLSSY